MGFELKPGLYFSRGNRERVFHSGVVWYKKAGLALPSENSRREWAVDESKDLDVWLSRGRWMDEKRP